MEYPELEPVLSAILKTVPVRKIMLFGSRARGEGRPESDYDLLIVVPPEYKTMRAWKDLYEVTSKVKRDFSLDLILATEEDLEKYRNAWMTVYPKALKEGRVLYAA
ncbi:nucleotidyltransferase domain-containing protein [Thermus caldifontis]|uniref:nucleotidyltransferase domain-containing protein n=1 Tax=Thermus caldifontis TaxID=1930763 RepID=UPI000DF365E6|nr:nucleotidyltransferase domain-containing protein [Thermus caldifontis]